MKRITYIDLLLSAIKDRTVLDAAAVQEFDSLSSLEFLNFIRTARVEGVSDATLLAETNRQLKLSDGDLQAMYVQEIEAKVLLLENQKVGLKLEVSCLEAQLKLQKLDSELEANSAQDKVTDNLAHKVICALVIASLAFTGGVFVGSVKVPQNTTCCK